VAQAISFDTALI